ncbi:D-2-hydroxyacid dehydrogenase [Marinoscillum sp.]|uniref:D-2-hydroxyacid dehydrogenase n=1 Tax=Marinoscillum sp. TaxID=2024838 RepID=UPI003BA87217
MSHNIVVLDGKYANPGDLSWDPLKAFGTTTVYDQTSPDEVISRSENADILIINKIHLGADQFEQLPQLKLVIISATGMDNVALDAARQYGVTVKNVAGYSTNSVAQHTFSLLLELTNQVKAHHESVAGGAWDKSKGFSYTLHTIPELSSMKLAVVGYGQIGQAVAKLGHAFGMSVMVVSQHATDLEAFELVSLNKAFQEADVVSLHWPMTKDRAGIINKELLSLMKPTSYLINTARGGLINEADLLDTLKANRIAGAGLDVLSQEPPTTIHPLALLDNCIITPHIAWASQASRRQLLDIVFQHVEDLNQK